MSVPLHKRKKSPFECRDYVIEMRKEVTKLILQDFGYRQNRFLNYISKSFQNRPYEALTQSEKQRYDYMYNKLISFNKWFIKDERQKVVDCLRNIVKEVNIANNTYPTCYHELKVRREHIEEAIGWCYTLTQELQYIIETLPVDINKYNRFAMMIDHQIELLKGWRQSDNKTFRALIDERKLLLRALPVCDSPSGANFANVNSNGNANYNNASNSNGVRPDFNKHSNRPIESQCLEKGGIVLLDEL